MVEEGFLSSDQLTVALAEQDRTGRPLGEILVELGFVSAGAVANALAEQHGGLLKTEYGVSTGLRGVAEVAGLANAPVRPVLPPQDERLAPKDEEPVGPLRVIVAASPDADGQPVAPAPTAAVPEPPPEIPNANETRIADLSARLDDVVAQLRVSQQARDAFSKRATELEAQLVTQSAPVADPAQAARVQQLEDHIQQLDAHIQAAAADRENIVEHYTQLQTQLAAAQAAASEPDPEPDPAQAATIQELQAQLQAAAAERQQLVESLTELQSRLGDASHARESERAEASAAAAARIGVLEGELKSTALDRGVLEQRVSELQGGLLASEQARGREIQTATAEALARIEELELQLQQAELNASAVESEGASESGRVAELEAQLQSVADERDALLAGLSEHDATMSTLREELAERDRQLAESAGKALARIEELELQIQRAELNASAVEDESAIDSGRVAELEAQLQAVADERDSLLAGLAEHDATTNALREELAERDRRAAENVTESPAGLGEHETTIARLRADLAERDRHLAKRATLVEHVEHIAMTGLREDLAERDRRLADNVNEIARLNREVAESAEREAAMTSLRDELADRDRLLAEQAKLVENVEHVAMAGLREDLSERDRQLAENADEIARTTEALAERDRQLSEIADEIARMNTAHEATMTRLREDLAGREQKLAESAEELARLREQAEAAGALSHSDDTAAEEQREHVLFVPTSSGYSLLERSGPPPAVGAVVEIDGDSGDADQFVVRKHGRPMPGGPRCAYLERA